MGRWGWVGVALGLTVFVRTAVGQETRPATSVPQAAWTGDWKVGIEPGEARESLPGEVFVGIAYGALWLILFLFVLRLSSLHAATRRDLAQLREILERRLGQGPQSGP